MTRYGVGAKLAGIIYLQDICPQRISGGAKQNFEVFDKLCGEDACRSVVLGTINWTNIPVNEHKVAEDWEQELRDKVWIDMIRKGSTVQRVDDAELNASPWNLVETVLFKGQPPALHTQRELMRMYRRLPQTAAATVMRRRLEELIQSPRTVGASKEEVRAFMREVEGLKGKSIVGRFFGRVFG